MILLVTCFFILTAVITVQVKQYNTQQKRLATQATFYEEYKDKTVFGTDVATIINKAVDDNAKNSHSIEVKIKFLESEEMYSMEPIIKQGIQTFIQHYGEKTFTCTQIDYEAHKITTIWIEEISIQ